MKYALIGCGRIASNHIKAASSNGLDIVALCDLDINKIDLLLEKNHLKIAVKKYTDYQLMISENSIDLVAIATDSGMHAEIAMFCIKHKIHVIIEKPIAMSVADANKIVEAAEQYQVKVSACHQNRFNVAVQKLINAVSEGLIGQISHASVNVRWNRNEEYYRQASWRGHWLSDGGCLMNQSIHGIDLIRWILGGEIKSVYGIIKNQFHKFLEVEDLGLAIVEFRNGTVATIEGTTNIFRENLEESLFVFGDSGTVKLGGKSANAIDKWDLKSTTTDSNDSGVFVEQTENVYGNGHILLYEDMIQSILSDRSPYVDAKQGRDAVELVLAIYQSALLGKPVNLPDDNLDISEMVGFFSEDSNDIR